MAKAIPHAGTSNTPQYGEILPQNYDPAKKYPTFVFCHGIGESGDRKSLQGFLDFHFFLHKWADGLAGEEIVFLLPQDMDGNVSTTTQLRQVWEIARNYTDGRMGLGGLSMGGGETLINTMSSLYKTFFTDITFVMPICPPSWESMDEAPLAQSEVAFWSFMGAKDTAVSIASFVNTMGDIINAGRTKNFNVSIYPNGTHYIWEQVMGTAMPVTPANSAKTWAGIADWAVVNNPAVRPMEYFLMQRPSSFKPLPRVGEAEPLPIPVPTPTPTPTPIPTPTPTDPVYYKNFIDTRPVFGVTWSDGSKTNWRLPTGATVKEVYTNGDAKANKQYLKITHSAGEKVFGPKK